MKEISLARFNEARRPAFLLSGLLTCGSCQGRYGIILQDRYGCLNHHRRGTCNNNRTIRRPAIEQRALTGLTEKLVSADMKKKVDAAKADIISGKIKVADYMAANACKY